MTAEELITKTLHKIRDQFYRNNPNLYYRDQTALIKAVTRYAYECNSRGWAFDTFDIFTGIMQVLNRIERKDFDYVPAYLDQTLRQQVNYHAEELSAKNKQINGVVERVMEKIPNRVDVQKREQVTETLSNLYAHLNKKKRISASTQMRLL